mmetsp:Transcript_25324/g.45651  ORF Transcript_25324/g.45651 Transcript_25324/m.45651 type:complete len:227 (+) Transcript_25324:1400-2080(+)
MRKMSTVLEDRGIFRINWRVLVQSPPWGPVAVKVCITLAMSSDTSASPSSVVPTDPSAPTVASPLPDDADDNDSCNPRPNATKSASYSFFRSSASPIASLSASRRFSSLASSTASLRSLSLCRRMLPNAHCNDRSHRSTKSTSMPDFNRARIRSAPAASCMSALRKSSARFHNLPALHFLRFSPEEQCVTSLGGVYSSSFSEVVASDCCSSRATSKTTNVGIVWRA